MSDENKIVLKTLYSDDHIIEELIPETLWVRRNKPDKDGHHWMKWEFYVFVSREYRKPIEESEVEVMLCGQGPTNGLRECRHTYWGEDGYLFYPNKKYIETALNWLSTYYDMD